MFDDNLSWKKYLLLHKKKEQQESGKCLVEGVRLCKEALVADWRIEAVFVTEAFCDSPDWDAFLPKLSMQEIPWRTLPAHHFKRLTETESPQGIVMTLQVPDRPWQTFNLQTASFILILEGIRDPGNLGTLIRTADWFGVDAILMSTDCVYPLNGKVLRSTMGSIFRIPVFQSANLVTDIKRLRQHHFQIITASLAGKHLSPGLQFTQKTALILGSEAHGVSGQLLEESDIVLKIPRYGRAESLNVSIAGGVFMANIAANLAVEKG